MQTTKNAAAFAKSRGRRVSRAATFEWTQTAIRRELDELLVTIVVPVFNERATIGAVIARIRAVEGFRKQIVVIDDGSTDGTTDVLDKYARDTDIEVHRHLHNLGKGAALKTGFAKARGEVVLIQDADLEYEPQDYPVLLRPFVERGAQVVYGSRFLVGGEEARVHRLWHFVGNRVLTFFSNLATGLELTDMETCYKAFHRDVLKQIEVESQRFDVEPELTAKVARLGVRMFEVPVRYAGRQYSEGKKIGWRDGVAALWAIARFGLRRRPAQQPADS